MFFYCNPHIANKFYQICFSIATRTSLTSSIRSVFLLQQRSNPTHTTAGISGQCLLETKPLSWRQTTGRCCVITFQSVSVSPLTLTVLRLISTSCMESVQTVVLCRFWHQRSRGLTRTFSVLLNTGHMNCRLSCQIRNLQQRIKAKQHENLGQHGG